MHAMQCLLTNTPKVGSHLPDTDVQYGPLLLYIKLTRLPACAFSNFSWIVKKRILMHLPMYLYSWSSKGSKWERPFLTLPEQELFQNKKHHQIRSSNTMCLTVKYWAIFFTYSLLYNIHLILCLKFTLSWRRWKDYKTVLFYKRKEQQQNCC